MSSRWLAAILLLAVLGASVSGNRFQQPDPQRTYHPPNASLQLRCPDYALPIGGPLVLTGEVVIPPGTYSREAARSISYRWSVENGTVIDGQGNTRVTVRPHNNETTSIRITLEPKNAPPETEIKKTCLIKLDSTCKVKKIDEYVALLPTDEQTRLNHAAEALKSEPNSFIYLIAYAGKESCVRESSWRLRRLRNYLSERHQIASNRIVTVDGGFRDQFTLEIFTSPNNDCGPLPSPSLLMGNVRMTGSCEDKYRR